MQENTLGNSQEAIKLFKLIKENEKIGHLVRRHLDQCVKGFVYLLKISDDAKGDSTGNGKATRRHIMSVWKNYYLTLANDRKEIWGKEIISLFKKAVKQIFNKYQFKEKLMSELEYHKKLIDKCYQKASSEQLPVVESLINKFKQYLDEDCRKFRR